MSGQTSSLCLQGAQDILTTLTDEEGPEADRMRSDAHGLCKTFDTWRLYPPDQRARREAISRLFSLYREAMELVGKK